MINLDKFVTIMGNAITHPPCCKAIYRHQPQTQSFNLLNLQSSQSPKHIFYPSLLTTKVPSLLISCFLLL